MECLSGLEAEKVLETHLGCKIVYDLFEYDLVMRPDGRVIRLVDYRKLPNGYRPACEFHILVPQDVEGYYLVFSDEVSMIPEKINILSL